MRLLEHGSPHRERDGELVCDNTCEACCGLTFIFGSQVIDEPIARFTKRVNDSRIRMAAKRAEKGLGL